MINIAPYGLSPNIFVYGNTWYRDGAIMAMVLEETNNLSQIDGWLNSLGVDDMYDNSRSESINEADNLGELLYLLSLASSPNQELIDGIVDEARSLIVPNTKYIQGITDGGLMCEYQTKWLLYGLNKLGISSSEFAIDGSSDSYGNMCWWFDLSTKENSNIDVESVQNSIFDYRKSSYPYLDWARLHYYQIKIEMPQLTYPISFEVADYPNRILCFTHGWTAAEMFLYLLDYNNFS